MSRLLYQAELHRQVDLPGPVETGPADQPPSCHAVVVQSPFTESNRRPSPYHGDALPTELKGLAPRSCRRLYLTPSASLRGVRREPRDGLERPCVRAPPRAREWWGDAGSFFTSGRTAGGGWRPARRTAHRSAPA